MKKIILLTLLIFGTFTPTFAQGFQQNDLHNFFARIEQGKNQKRPDNAEEQKRKQEFEQRLQLTEEQKIKARKLRQQGREEIRPLMQAAYAKFEELRAASTAHAPKEETEKIKSDILMLNRKIHEQKIKNMKAFEEILTKPQLEELEKMKQEGRKQFDKEHGKKF